MPRRFIEELRDGDTLDDVYLVGDKQIRTNRNGVPYMSLELRDRTGGMIARLWNVSESISRSVEPGDFIHASGKVQLYQGTLQIILNRLERIDIHKVELADFLPQSEQSIPRLMERLRGYLQRIEKYPLRALAECFLMDPDVVAGLTSCPAGVKLHHAFVGGLLEHIVTMLEGAERLLPLYPGVDRDLVFMGIFLHDIGKIRELTYRRAFGYTDEGQLVGHIPIGIEMLAQMAAKVPELIGEPVPRELLMRLQHIIVSHHGEIENGSPKIPMTPEAMFVYLLDLLDTRVHMILREIRNDRNNNTSWTPYSSNLGRRVYKGGTNGELYGESDPTPD